MSIQWYFCEGVVPSSDVSLNRGGGGAERGGERGEGGGGGGYIMAVVILALKIVGVVIFLQERDGMSILREWNLFAKTRWNGNISVNLDPLYTVKR